MILEQYYIQKKKKIDEIINSERPIQEKIEIGLYNDKVFKRLGDDKKKPLIMFKYDNVEWNTSSEKEYKANVDFCMYIVLHNSFEEDHIESFALANQIDRAILLHPTRTDIKRNKEAIEQGASEVELITNSAIKTSEGQYTVADEYWEKNDFYIWKIAYRTTLIEREYKKRYTMISNNFFTQYDLDTNREELSEKLRAIGFDLNDYDVVEQDGKQLLVIKNVEERINVGSKKTIEL